MRIRDLATSRLLHCTRFAIAALSVLIGLTAPAAYAAIPDGN